MRTASEAAQSWAKKAAAESERQTWAASLGYPDHKPMPPEELRVKSKELVRMVRKAERRRLRKLGVPKEVIDQLLPLIR